MVLAGIREPYATSSLRGMDDIDDDSVIYISSDTASASGDGPVADRVRPTAGSSPLELWSSVVARRAATPGSSAGSGPANDSLAGATPVAL